MDKLLTIVIPTYNMQDYLRKCLDSLIVDELKMPLLEVLVINDGSKDSSSEIAHEYESRFPGIFRVIDKENGGHGSCCNVGLAEATGKYFRILDADDWLTNVEIFLDRLLLTDSDIVFTQLNRYYQDSGNTELVIAVPFTSKSQKVDTICQETALEEPMFCNLWYATYRTSLLKKEFPLFAKERFYTDSILFAAPLILSDTFTSLDFPLYNYRLNRPGQSVDAGIQDKNRGMVVRTLSHMMTFVERYYENLPESKKKLIDVIVSKKKGYWMMEMMDFLPYHTCLRHISFMYPRVKEYSPAFLQSKKAKLYRRVPFCFLYLANKVRLFLFSHCGTLSKFPR